MKRKVLRVADPRRVLVGPGSAQPIVLGCPLNRPFFTVGVPSAAPPWRWRTPPGGVAVGGSNSSRSSTRARPGARGAGGKALLHH